MQLRAIAHLTVTVYFNLVVLSAVVYNMSRSVVTAV